MWQFKCRLVQNSDLVSMCLQIGSAEQYAQAGDVILSPEVAAVTAGHCTCDQLESNNARLVSMAEPAVVSQPPHVDVLVGPICVPY